MTGLEHHLEAERILRQAHDKEIDRAAALIAEAQVHATLARTPDARIAEIVRQWNAGELTPHDAMTAIDEQIGALAGDTS